MKPVIVKGQIEPGGSTVTEDYICRLTIEEDQLLIERDEFGKEVNTLYDIQIHDLLGVEHLNAPQTNQNIVRQVLDAILLLLGTIFIQFKAPEPVVELLRVTFMQHSEQHILTFRLLEGSASAITNRYSDLLATMK